ncbi:membrane protein insertase YidC [Tenuifilum thalassicum]|uniref:Membrane protein insertase YidC n=1 Tax=Tenuifilum thalassicum TaxID=2590900 RepID=A0A7D4C8N3_9BACT|nr:membrane protein insertase YidC [Tenuifilum thalassicum]QKG79702.1 membrane protein insertase YidC [Tenuifilum thalassicum]
MDRNTIIGLVLIFLIMIGFGYFTQPSKEEREAMQRKADSIAQVQALQQQKKLEEEKAEKKVASIEVDTIKQEQVESQLGAFSNATSGVEKFVTLENDLMKVTLTSKGGRVYSVELKKYKTYNGDPLVLFTGDENTFGLQFWGDNKAIKTNDLFFTPQSSDSVIVASADSVSLTMRLQAGDSAYIDYTYTIKPESYMLGFDIKFSGLDKTIGNRMGYIDLIWDTKLLHLEKGLQNEQNYTTIAYLFQNGDYEELNPRSKGAEKEEISNKLKWVNFKHQFFSSVIVAKDHFVNADLLSEKLNDGNHVKHFNARLALPFQNFAQETINLSLFFGPNHFKTLEAYGLGFEKVVPLGSNIIRWINKYVVINVFNFLSRFISNYGLIILILTILIKLVLFPLTYKSYSSSAKMRVLKPQIDEINAKYPKKEDAMKKQQAVMALYKKVGVNPMGGCIPVLIQFPILIAMFRFFPASFELRQQSFLWADDLSSFDSILNLPFSIPWYGDHVSLFTLLMAVAMFVTSKMNADQMGDSNAQMPGMKFMMTWMMPIMLLLWFNNYSAGLSYYYFLSNLITIGQTFMIRRFVDDKALLAKLHENAKKPVTKSKWQQRLEEMAKQQQQAKKKK